MSARCIVRSYCTLIADWVGLAPTGPEPKLSTAPGLGVCEWSHERLYDKSVSLILNTDEILKLVKKKMN